MRRTRAQGRKDANHKELVDFARSLGMSWQDTCEIPAALDGIVGYMGVDNRVEIKNGSKPVFTEAEGKTIREWKGRRPLTWMSKFDVLSFKHDVQMESAKDLSLASCPALLQAIHERLAEADK